MVGCTLLHIGNIDIAQFSINRFCTWVNCQFWCLWSTGSHVDCKVWQQQEGRICSISPSHCETTCLWRSCPVLSERPAWGETCSPSRMTTQLSFLFLPPPLLDWKDRAGLLYQSVKFLPSSSLNTAWAYNLAENIWCHYKVKKVFRSVPYTPKNLNLLST